MGVNIPDIDFTKVPGHPYIDPNKNTNTGGNAGGGGTPTEKDKSAETVQSVVDFAGTGASNLAIAEFMQNANVDVNAVADAMGVDQGTANKMYNASNGSYDC